MRQSDQLTTLPLHRVPGGAPFSGAAPPVGATYQMKLPKNSLDSPIIWIHLNNQMDNIEPHL